MKTLAMDTSHRYLCLVLMEEDKIVASYQEFAWKKQSELVFVTLIDLMKKASWSVDDIDEVVITKGPGSFTGVRIAMTIAKVLCSTKQLPLYTISTLQLFAGTRTCEVILDARSCRVYYGQYKNGVAISECIKELDALDKDKSYVGDCDLVGQSIQTIDFAQHFVDLRSQYCLIGNVHTLVPEYLKQESAYGSGL